MKNSVYANDLALQTNKSTLDEYRQHILDKAQ